MATRTRRRHIPVVRILVLVVFLAFVLAPLYWVFVTSIKPSDDYLATPPVWFPAQPTIGDSWTRSSTWRKNSSAFGLYLRWGPSSVREPRHSFASTATGRMRCARRPPR